MAVGGIELYNSTGRIAPRKLLQPKELAAEQESESPQESFGDLLSNAIKGVDKAHKESEKLVEHLVTGSKPVSVHETMIALEKAEVAFELMNQVRRRVVRAYEEILRTPV